MSDELEGIHLTAAEEKEWDEAAMRAQPMMIMQHKRILIVFDGNKFSKASINDLSILMSAPGRTIYVLRGYDLATEFQLWDLDTLAPADMLTLKDIMRTTLQEHIEE